MPFRRQRVPLSLPTRRSPLVSREKLQVAASACCSCRHGGSAMACCSSGQAAPPIIAVDIAPAIAAPDVEMAVEEEECRACSYERRFPGEAHAWPHTCRTIMSEPPKTKPSKVRKDGVQKATKGLSSRKRKTLKEITEIFKKRDAPGV